VTTLSRFAAKLSRHAGIYAGGQVLALALGLVNVAVVTRFLPPSAFGELAIFLVFASLLTILYNLGTLQGTFMWVYGAGGDEGDDDGGGYDEVAGKRVVLEGPEQRRAVTTGLILTALVALAGTLVVVGYSADIAKLLSGDPRDADLVRLAAASAAFGSLWRFASQVLRYEHRPVAYVLLYSLRPVLALAIAIPLLATGSGARGIFTGLVLGTAVGFLISLAAGRRSYGLGFLPRGLRIIPVQGRYLVPVAILHTILHQGDLLLLSRYVDSSDLGLYRIASRLAVVIPYMFSALSMAWSPIYKTNLAAAARQERGTQFGTLVLTLVSFCFAWALLGLGIGADVLVRIAPPSYAGAAPLIPIIGLSLGLMGMYFLVFRVSDFPNKMRKLLIANLVCTLLFFPIALLLMPALGAYGAALSVGIVAAMLTAFMLAFMRFGPTPTPIQYGRIGGAVAVGALCYGLERILSAPAGSLQPLVALTSFLAFPLLLVISGLLPRSEANALLRMMRSAMGRGESGDGAAEMLDRVPARQRHFVERILDRGSVDEALATEFGMDTQELHREFVRALRRAGHIGAPGDADGRIGTYLLSDEPVGQRTAAAARLWESEEVDPAELDELEQFCDRLRDGRRVKVPLPRRR
jgi:O-antigen/teichoic acid export membrane protein